MTKLLSPDAVPTITPTDTPNVVITNPAIRKGINTALGVAGVVVTVATIVDVAIPAIDYAFITMPATQIILGVAALFGLAVTSPNYPK